MSSDFALHNYTSPGQMEARKVLLKLFSERPFADDILLTNLGLFMRSSAMAKLLFLDEVYQAIESIPGDLVVFGTWLGQDMVVLESLRAIREPYNVSRKIIGFDTFEGYPDTGEGDRTSDVVKKGGYATPPSYEIYLAELLKYHREENTMGHAVEHRLIKGDLTKMLPSYLKEHPESIIALAYIDLALFQATKCTLEEIADRLVPGSVVVFDELNDPKYPGEGQAARAWWTGRSFDLRRSKFLPDRSLYVCK